VIDLYFLTRRYAGMMGIPLPCPGSPSEQPAALLDAFAIIDRLEKDDG
jgi:hypothetical protein